MTDTGSSDWQSPSGGPERPRYGEYAPAGATPSPAPSLYEVPGGPVGWAPPPKPGIIPLRPLGFGTLLTAPFTMLRRGAGILGLSFLLQFGVLLVGGGIVAAIVFAGFGRITDFDDPDQQPLVAGAVVGSVLGGLALLVLSYVVSALLQGIVVDAAARATLGEKPTVKGVWPRVKPRLGRLVGWTLLLGLALIVVVAVLAGVVLLGVALGPVGIGVAVTVAILLGLGAIVAGVWVFTKLSIVPSILVLEQSTLRGAIARSWRLTDGFFWRTFGAQALVTVMLSVAIQIITTPISLLQFGAVLIDPNGTGSGIAVAVLVQVLTVVVSILGGAVSAFVVSSLVALIYLDLRMRKEGLDLVLQRHVESGVPGADPFAPGAA
ncbi:hypothetical protein [Naasia sp. SYSU D00057]|uniref:hypothetical protein n=1 Tax=Naasia sp. SYSU D00057 TaxID=2817380 RepID=UPI001B30F600|nr:hypothetical protein [Naasia sp. SYSU D00057]